MKISHQLRLLTLINSACLILVIALTAYQLGNLRTTFTGYEQDQAVSHRLTDIKATVLAASRTDIMSPDIAALLGRTDRAVQQHWQEVAATLPATQRTEASKAILGPWQEYVKNLHSAIKISETSPQDALSIPDQSYTLYLVPMTQSLDRLAERQQKVALAHKAQIEAVIGRLMWMVLIPLTLAGIVIVAFQTSFGRHLKRRVSEMSQVATRLREGDLSHRLPARSQDEIGELAASINGFVHALEDILRDVQHAAGHIRGNAEAIRDKADTVGDHTRTQSEEVSGVSSSVDQIRQAINDVAANSGDAAVSTTAASNLAQEVRVIGTETMSLLGELDQTVDGASERIRELASAIGQIGEASAFIKEIAEQTNLLALNAAIEAARAGEHGRGFAVVADEVRKLSERTAQSTTRINEILQNVGSYTGQAEQAIQLARRNAAAGVAQGERFSERLQEIEGAVARVSEMIHGIASAAEEQSAATQHISGHIESVARIAEETVDKMAHTGADISLLVSIADRLQQAVGRFRLSAGTPGLAAS